MRLLGAIEAGGTKFVCGLGTSPDDLKTCQFPTTSPDETIERAIDFFRHEAGSRLAAVGIGSFGPVDLDPKSSKYGFITNTPKPGWQQTDVAGRIGRALEVPVNFDTDVNAAALGEARWGAAMDMESCIYLTVGTGIGGGALVNGRLLHGLMHPEMGHIRIPHDWTEDPYAGGCPFHGDCLEGLASGPAILGRWKQPGAELRADHAAWVLEAKYLALALANFAFTLSPERMILGGGVMQQAQLFPMIRKELEGILNGYLEIPENYVAPPALGNRAGVLGALAIAEMMLAR